VSKESVAFLPEEAVQATKDFVGYIVDCEYGMSPLGMTGRADIQASPQLAVQIRTEAYERDQYEWYRPSKVKLTKWIYFIEALARTGALKDTVSSGKNVAEKLKNFAKSLVGMNFRWLEKMNMEGVVRPIERLLLPEEYLGKVEVQKAEEIETEDVVL